MTDINIFSNEFCQNRYHYYNVLRERGGVIYSDLSNCWLVLNHSYALEVLSDKQRFGSKEIFSEIDPVLFGDDTGSHNQNKKAVTDHFEALDVKSHRTEYYTSKFQLVATKLVKRAQALPLFDVLYDFVIPFSVSASLITLEKDADLEEFNILIDNDIEKILVNLNRLYASSSVQNEKMIELMNKNGHGNSKVSALAEDDRLYGKFEIHEIKGTLRMLFKAGLDTTISLISNSILFLLNNRSIQDLVNQDIESNMSLFVLESLRYHSPAQCTFRIANSDTELDGVQIRKGDLISVLIGAANWDASVFQRPEYFDIQRNNTPFLSYGRGMHFCIGFHVSKLSSRIALQEFWTLLSYLKPLEEKVIYNQLPMVMSIFELRVENSRVNK